MFPKAGCKHVRQNAGHDRRPEKVIQSLQSTFYESDIHIVEEIVDILHRDREIFKAKLKREHRIFVELGFINFISMDRHCCQSKIATILAEASRGVQLRSFREFRHRRREQSGSWTDPDLP